MKVKPCLVCSNPELSRVVNRFASLPSGMAGKRGPRSLAKTVGVSRKDLAAHQRQCLTDEHREKVLTTLVDGVTDKEGGA